jgi:hypothetical protein
MIEGLIFVAGFICGFGAAWSLAWARIESRIPPEARQAKKRR